MSFLDIQGKSQTLKEAFDKAQSSKKYWESQIKELIETTLNQVKDTTYLDWIVQVPDNTSLGLFINDEAGKEIANLLFSLTYDGLISVDVSFRTQLYNPIRGAQSFRGLMVMEPKSINQDVIYESIERFLDIIRDEYFTKPTYPIQNLQGYFR